MPRERKGVSKPLSGIQETRRYFVIASEGADTERIYFESLRDKLIEEGQLNSLIKVEFLKRQTEAERAKSSHKAVIKQLDTYKKAYRIDSRDELWLIIDRDKQNNTPKNISDIAQSCLQKSYFLGLSNPAFEIWLLLHLTDLTTYTTEALEVFLQNKKVSASSSSKTALKKELSDILGGFNETAYNANLFLPFIQLAVQRAKLLDTNPASRWIDDTLGTRVYRLIENIFKEQ
jgi:RloB-like protein